MAGHAEETAALSGAAAAGRTRGDGGPRAAARGPEIGRLLGLLREAQAIGAVTTREAALAYLRRARDQALDTSGAGPLE